MGWRGLSTHQNIVHLLPLAAGKKSEKKRKNGDSAVRWSEGGEVQLLSIAEKAGVDDDSKPEADETPAKTEETAASAEPKEEDKRVVTVATFGFPEVRIQPPSAEEEEGKQKMEGKEDGKETPAKQVEDKCSLEQSATKEV